MAGNKYYTPSSAGHPIEERAIQTTTGATDAGKLIAADATGKLAQEFLPTGVGPDTAVLQASENLAAGDLVNKHTVTGSPRVRKADASSATKQADGFVKSAVTSGQNATVYFSGVNDVVSGLTGDQLFLSASSAGQATSTPPTGAGVITQNVGTVISATSFFFVKGQKFEQIA